MMRYLLIFLLSIQGLSAQNVIVFDKDTTLTRSWYVPSNSIIRCENNALITVEKRFAKGAIILDNVENVTFENVNIDIAATVNFTVGIYAIHSKSITIRNCNFYNSEDSLARANNGWTLMGVNFRYTEDILIEKNYSNGCQFKLAGGPGGIKELVFQDNKIENITQMGVSVVVKSDKDTTYIQNVKILNNYFRNIDDYAIYLGIDHGKGYHLYPMYMNDIQITRNIIDTVGQWGGMNRGIVIRGTKDSKKIIISDNTMHSSKEKHGQGIEVKSANPEELLSDVEIVGNKIHGVDQWNIRASSVNGFVIADNVCSNGRGIRVGKYSWDGLIDGNHVSHYRKGDGIRNWAHSINISNNIVLE